VTVLCAVGVERPVSGRDVVWIVQINRWASDRGEVNEAHSQNERRSGAWI
jgi:hypothetical protein